MKKALLVLVLAALAYAGFAAWQVSSVYVANFQLQGDLNGLVVEQRDRLQGAAFSTEAELRDSVANRARQRGIQLKPQQVIVERIMTPNMTSIALSADYDATVDLLFYSYALHFRPSSKNSITK